MKYLKKFDSYTNDPRIDEPRKYSIVWHTGWQQNDEKYPCHVYILNGQYYSNGGTSNFWYWKRILPNGSLAKEEYGYGDFRLPRVIMDSTYTEEEIKAEYPKKYQEYLIKRDASKYNL